MSDLMRPEIWGHRGARGLAPENTIPSFQLALQLGVDGVELDVHLSKDGELVVMHDDRVDRTTNGEGFIRDLTWGQLRELDAGFKFGSQWKGVKVPLLREVLSLGIKCKVELKHGSSVYPGIEEKVLQEVSKYSSLDRVEFTSFDYDALSRLKDLEPKVQVGIIVFGRPSWFLEHAKKVRATSMHCNISLVTKEDVNLVNLSGFRIGLWTVNEPWELSKAWEMCPNSITTDYPDRAIKKRVNCSP
jgi:glycerophosphoryl diester phosphodiesterase